MECQRDKKGKSRLILPHDYCVVDIETTGLTPTESEIIEISAVKYRNLRKVDTFSTLVRPEKEIGDMITELTGIDNEMVADAPDVSEAILRFSEFAADDILMGYNVNFDVNFLYDALMICHGKALSNDFVDVLRLTRKALPNFERRSQTRVAAFYGIPIRGAHRAETDCEICNAIYQRMREEPCIIEWTKGRTSVETR